jgi:hypothetical protein
MRIGDDGGGGFTCGGNAQLNIALGDDDNLYFVGREKSCFADISGNCEIYVSDNFRIGNPGQMGGKADTVMPMTMTGGTINAGNVEIGWNPDNDNATASLDMSGGLLIARNNFRVGRTTVATLSPGGVVQVGNTVNVEDGGALKGLINIIGTSVTDSGLIILDGYKLPEVFDLVEAGLLKGNDSPVGIAADFDVTNPGKTTVWAEEPIPCQAFSPRPFDTAQEIPVGSPVVLSWTAGEGLGLGRHYVFFDEDESCVADASCGESGAACWRGMLRASTTSWSAGLLELWKTYYWRIDEVGATCCQGKVWSFTTGCALIPGDINRDCVLNFDDYALVADDYGEEQFWPE